jgi:hypothetical protein
MTPQELESILARRDLAAAESARDHVGPHSMFLANHYWRTHDWVERSLVVHMVQDQRGPHLRSVFADFLRAPAPTPEHRDHVELTKAVCLVQLKGDLSLFALYQADREALRRDIEAEVGGAAQTARLLGTPTPVAAPDAPAPAPATGIPPAAVAHAPAPAALAAAPPSGPPPWATAQSGQPGAGDMGSGARVAVLVAAAAALVMVLAGVVFALLFVGF